MAVQDAQTVELKDEILATQAHVQQRCAALSGTLAGHIQSSAEASFAVQAQVHQVQADIQNVIEEELQTVRPGTWARVTAAQL